MTERTMISFLLDETGSMQGIKGDTIGGFNEYIKTLQKKITGKARFTLLKFDSQAIQKEICAGVKLSDAPLLTEENYQPRAGTPLLDATWEIIQRTERALEERKKEWKVVVAIQTDGMENASKNHSVEDVRALVEKKQSDGWVFTFLGAGIDAFAQAGQMGFGARQTMSYDRRETKVAMAAAASNTSDFSNTGISSALDFSDEQRKASKDKFHKEGASA